jgi:hypothetical protein
MIVDRIVCLRISYDSWESVRLPVAVVGVDGITDRCRGVMIWIGG